MRCYFAAGYRPGFTLSNSKTKTSGDDGDQSLQGKRERNAKTYERAQGGGFMHDSEH